MKRLLIVGGLLLAAGIVIAASVSHTLPAAGDATINGYNIPLFGDSANTADKLMSDTIQTNVIDVSDYSAIGIWANLGTIVRSDSSTFNYTDIKFKTKLRGATSTEWYTARIDTMGGDTTAVKDDSTKFFWIKLDTIPCNELMIETVVTDSVKAATVLLDTSATLLGRYKTYVPLHYVVVGR